MFLSKHTTLIPQNITQDRKKDSTVFKSLCIFAMKWAKECNIKAKRNKVTRTSWKSQHYQIVFTILCLKSERGMKH